MSQQRCFTFKDIVSSDELVKLYTGFPSYEILLVFYEFLGPAVDELKDRGEERKTTRESHNTRGS